MQNPLVSIIVPVYNVEAYIKKCLDSIVGQTYKNIEIIVVIDGSTDGSERIARSYTDKRIKIVWQKNQGLGGARNTGIENSNGEWILLVDSDDWIKSNTVEILIKRALEDSSDVVIYDISYVYPDGQEKDRTPKIRENVCINGEEALRRELIGIEYRFHAPNKFCKKSIYDKYAIKFPPGKLYEDVATTYKLLAYAGKVTLLDEQLYFYLQKRSDSITGAVISERMFSDLFEAINDVIVFVNDFSKLSELQEAKQAFYLDNVISFCNYLYKLEPNTRRMYYQKMKNDKNWNYMKRILSNHSISSGRKLRGIMINNFWEIYVSVMKIIRG